MTTDDMKLVREYARQNSETAFAGLVSRHVNLVYSVALRQTDDTHLAEEITQAVFIILARKAKSLGDKTILSGWLCRTARYVSANALTIRRRRQRREQEAYMQTILNEPEPEIWHQIAPLLDAALARLGGKDHDAIVLRFFEGKELNQVGAALGVSEDAAKKRVGRAVEKLRRFFRQHGVDSTAATIGETISTHSIQAAPAALAHTAVAAALSKGAAVSISTITLTKAALLAMQTKITVTTATVAVILVGTGAFFFARSGPSSSAGPANAPVRLANDAFGTAIDYIEGHAVLSQDSSVSAEALRAHNSDDRYVNDVDPDTRRTPDSSPAGHIKSLVAPVLSGSGDYLASLNTPAGRPLQSGRYVHYEIGKDSPLRGKRIRLSGWIKTKDVANWVGGSLAILNADGHVFASDAMCGRPISGTTDWDQIEIVTDVPSEPCTICFGPMLYGTGEVWMDDFQIAPAPPGTPITDDRIWHVWSIIPNNYSETTDDAVTHDGHPTLCLAYLPSGAAPKGSGMWWGQDIRDTDKYRNHIVRMTVWIKTEKVSGRLRPNLRPKGPNFKLLAQDRLTGGSRITGTTDWTQYTVICSIPKDTQCLDTGFAFSGNGRFWIDMNSLKYEIFDNPDKPRLIQ